MGSILDILGVRHLGHIQVERLRVVMYVFLSEGGDLKTISVKW